MNKCRAIDNTEGQTQKLADMHTQSTKWYNFTIKKMQRMNNVTLKIRSDRACSAGSKAVRHNTHCGFGFFRDLVYTKQDQCGFSHCCLATILERNLPKISRTTQYCRQACCFLFKPLMQLLLVKSYSSKYPKTSGTTS